MPASVPGRRTTNAIAARGAKSSTSDTAAAHAQTLVNPDDGGDGARGHGRGRLSRGRGRGRALVVGYFPKERYVPFGHLGRTEIPSLATLSHRLQLLHQTFLRQQLSSPRVRASLMRPLSQTLFHCYPMHLPL
jgi:hypothetical protein